MAWGQWIKGSDGKFAGSKGGGGSGSGKSGGGTGSKSATLAKLKAAVAKKGGKSAGVAVAAGVSARAEKIAALQARVKAARTRLEGIRAAGRAPATKSVAKATGKPSPAKAEKLKAAIQKKREREAAKAEKAKAAEAKRAARVEKLKAAAQKKADREKSKAETAAKREAAAKEKVAKALAKEKARQEKSAAKTKDKSERIAAKLTPKAGPSTAAPFTDPSKAKELASALSSQDGVKTRALLREHIDAVLPGMATRDGATASMQVHPDAQWLAGPNKTAGAVHAWNGDVHVRERFHGDAKTASKLLANGALNDARIAGLTHEKLMAEGSERDSYLGKFQKGGRLDDPQPALRGMSMLIHEELHGMSRSTMASYTGHGAVLEEVGVELSARHATLRLTPHLESNPAIARQFAHDHTTSPYHREIVQVVGIVSRHTGLEPKAATALIVDAHRRGPAAAGAKHFNNADEHLNSFVGALGVRGDQAMRIRGELSRLSF